MSRLEQSPPEARWRSAVLDPRVEPAPPAPLIGALPGEGIGAEAVEAALEVLRGLEPAGSTPVRVERGGPIGLAAERSAGWPS